MVKKTANNNLVNLFIILVILVSIGSSLVIFREQISSFFENSFNTVKNLIMPTEDKENFALFTEPSGNTGAQQLGQIFKKGHLNLGTYPNVEIKPGQQLFNHNKFLPECCMYYSQYSTDKGCPCITPDQQYYLQRRGLNRHKAGFDRADLDYKNVFFSPTQALKGDDTPFKEHGTQYLKERPDLTQEKRDEIKAKIEIN